MTVPHSVPAACVVLHLSMRPSCMHTNCYLHFQRPWETKLEICANLRCCGTHSEESFSIMYDTTIQHGTASRTPGWALTGSISSWDATRDGDTCKHMPLLRRDNEFEGISLHEAESEKAEMLYKTRACIVSILATYLEDMFPLEGGGRTPKGPTESLSPALRMDETISRESVRGSVTSTSQSGRSYSIGPVPDPPCRIWSSTIHRVFQPDGSGRTPDPLPKSCGLWFYQVASQARSQAWRTRFESATSSGR
ncbi:hypothetical protein F5884DRAFT_293640 [Xylogone sp. PMI_703]|nr:hypothetical protein F5884DRAFT_293640 [Xylogone sp. PMI_703]